MKKQNIKTYEEAVAYLYDVPRFTKKNSIEDTRKYLKKIGSPDRKMRIVHVAGTNGKGSVCAYLRSIFEAAGLKVAVFTSPHLVDVRERFYFDGKYVSREDFLRTFLQIYDSLDWEALEKDEGYHPTFFEYIFFMAMILFEEWNPDICILETGLGGRLDATNSVEKKLISVITRISLEHTEYLGDTIEKIAGEKAGIMCEGAPVVYTDAVADASKVFEKQASKLGILSYPVSKTDIEFRKFNNKTIDFSLQSLYYGYISLSLRTIAFYQMENAALAVRTVEVLSNDHKLPGGIQLSKEQIEKGVESCFWAGRMEEVLPCVYVDGAHNEDGIRAFLETVGQDGMSKEYRTLLFSVVQDKDYRKMIEHIIESGLFSKIAIAHMQTGRATDLRDIYTLFEDAIGRMGCDKIELLQFDHANEAFDRLVEARKDEERIYVAGSLYLVGEIKEKLDSPTSKE